MFKAQFHRLSEFQIDKQLAFAPKRHVLVGPISVRILLIGRIFLLFIERRFDCFLSRGIEWIRSSSTPPAE
jgi:hypothetical protein